MASPEDERGGRYCFGCGDLNPHGLRLSFRREGGQAAMAGAPQEAGPPADPAKAGGPQVVHPTPSPIAWGPRVVADFTPGPEHQGWPGIVHGGLVAALLDEAMGWALAAADAWAVTGKIEVWLRQPVLVGQPLRISGRLLEDRGRALLVRAEIAEPQGRLLAEGRGIFLRVAQEREQELKGLYRLQA